MSNVQTQLYEQLDKLDDFLAGRNQSERLLFGLVVGALLAALVYFLLFDLSDSTKANSSSSYHDVQSKVAKEQTYIDSMENGGFLVLEQKVNAIKAEISQSQQSLQQLQKLRDEIFSYSKDWFLTFDDASKSATSMGLTVNGTDIIMNDADSLGGMKHSSFVLFGYGRYSAILKYIDWLELYGKFVSIDSVIVESKDNRLNFSVSIRNFRGGA